MIECEPRMVPVGENLHSHNVDGFCVEIHSVDLRQQNLR